MCGNKGKKNHDGWNTARALLGQRDKGIIPLKRKAGTGVSSSFRFQRELRLLVSLSLIFFLGSVIPASVCHILSVLSGFFLHRLWLGGLMKGGQEKGGTFPAVLGKSGWSRWELSRPRRWLPSRYAPNAVSASCILQGRGAVPQMSFTVGYVYVHVDGLFGLGGWRSLGRFHCLFSSNA